MAGIACVGYVRSVVEPTDITDEIESVLLTAQDIDDRLTQIAAKIDADYGGREVLLVGVLKGATMVMADLARKMHTPAQIDWMAISSYGAGTKSSGIVRILKDLDSDVSGCDVLVVEDVLDSGLTLDWLRRTLGARGATSLRVMALLRKPEAVENGIEVDYLGFDIGEEFVIGYGLDYDERYRNLRCIATLHPRMIS